MMASLLSNPHSSFLSSSSHLQSKQLKLAKGFSPELEVSFNPRENLNKSLRLLRICAHAKGNCCDNFQEFIKHQHQSKWDSKLDVESFSIQKGLSEDTIRKISSIRNEPDWMLEFRMSSFHKFWNMKEPKWSDNNYPPIDFQNICYYSEPKANMIPEVLKEIERLDVPINEQSPKSAVDVIFDSVSIVTTKDPILEKGGVIKCSISEAIRAYPDLVRKYLGKVVPPEDNYYAALNSAVFSDGTFCYIPKGKKCPKELSSYFRINAEGIGQFERTIIIADEGSEVSYYEGCTAPSRDKNQLHAAVVELYCAKDAKIFYSTLQTWFPGDEQGNGGIYNFVTKRGLCAGDRSKISWTQVEMGSAITWKYPSVVLEGDESIGEFYSLTVTKDHQQADTGTKMIHKGKNTKSMILSKGVSIGKSKNCYRGLVQVFSGAKNARNISQCDSMLAGDTATANTYPYIQVKNPSASVEHEASTSNIGEDKIFYFKQRGCDREKAVTAMITGFCEDVVKRFPKERSSDIEGLLGSLKLQKFVG